MNPTVQRYVKRVRRILRREPAVPTDLEDGFLRLADQVVGYTMTTIERQYALWQGLRHLERTGVEGAFVECGVWRGGSTMLAALTLLSEGEASREIWLYDTFDGMTEPGEWDVYFRGQRMKDLWEKNSRPSDVLFSPAPLPEVRANVASTGYPMEKVTFVEGRVEDTLPEKVPERIALLRLDTDWYESTRHELEALWPLLSPGGILLIDDYGDFLGARKAVDEFFAGRDEVPFLNRIDASARLVVKGAG